MRTFGTFLGFVIAIIIGAAALWIAARFVHIPGIKATNTNNTAVTPTNTGASQSSKATQNR